MPFTDILIKSTIKDYSVAFISNFYESIKENFEENDVIIVDETVGVLYNLPDTSRIIRLPACEDTKSIENLQPVINKLISLRLRKNNKIIVVGGGTIQDAASFIASIYFRGVDWIFYPTTLLSQGDSCVGGKTSINVGTNKNQLGNFHPPKNIYISSEFLNTLTELDLISGIGEMLHFALTGSNYRFDIFSEKIDAALSGDIEAINSLVFETLNIKKYYVELDEFDQKERKLLNYGHTFGHGIEGLSDYSVPHGIAVTHGMKISNRLSKHLGYLSEEFYNKYDVVLSKIAKDPFKITDIDKYIDFLSKDKKNEGEFINPVLTKSAGFMFIQKFTREELKKNLVDCLADYF